MNQDKWRPYLPALMLFLIMIIVSSYLWKTLPARIPTQFSADGKPVSFSTREAVALLMPGIYLFLLVTLPQMIGLSPKNFGLRGSQALIAKTITAVGLLFASTHVGLLLSAADPEKFRLTLFVCFGLGLFMIALGLTLEKIERNVVIGFRTPWSMASEANWSATHRFGAKVMLITGVLTLVMSVLSIPSLIAAISSLIFAAIIPVFYSLWYYQNMEKPRA